MRRPLRIALALTALGLSAAPALGVEGSLYPRAAGVHSVVGPFTENRNGNLFTIQAPELRPAYDGNKWEMTWGCTVPGTQLDFIQWSAARTAPPSNFETEVTREGTRYWAEMDVDMAPASVGGRGYTLALPAGTCLTQLRLNQVGNFNQHARTYYINDPKVYVRDLTAPSVSLGGLPGGWLAAGHAPLQVSWSAGDNFDADGMGLHQVLIGGVRRWAGVAGPGNHAVSLPLSDVPDGVHAVQVRVDGDGTPAGEARGTISLDRTPPAAEGTATVTARPGVVAFAWTVTDAVSGPAGTSIDVNTAPNGATGGSWQEVASTPAGSGRAEVDLRAFGEGVHAWRIRATDRAGNGRVVGGSGTAAVDLTPPSVSVSGVPASWTRRATVGIDQSDALQAALGLGATEIAVNAAPDGATTGAWVPLSSANLGPGRHGVGLDLSAVASGRHALRVRVRNGGSLGASLMTDRIDEVRVDTTSPTVASVAFTAAGGDRVRAAWQADDAHSGVASTAVQWWNGSSWRPLGTTAGGNGAGALVVDTSALPRTASRFRVLVTDGAGNANVAAGELAANGSGPVLSDLRLQGGPPWVLTWQQQDRDGFGACVTAVEVAPTGEESWRELLSGRRGAGAQRAVLPLAGLAPGAYRVRVVTCDAAGNTSTAATGGLQVAAAASAAGAPAADLPSRLRGARLTANFEGAARALRRGRHAIEVRTVGYARRVTIIGQLEAADGTSLAGVDLEVRGTSSRVLGRGRTSTKGRFRITVRPRVNGPLRIGAATGGRPVRLATPVALEVDVRPRILLRASATTVAAGGRVTFSGRITPSPSRAKVRRKSIVLEWLDPVRQVWRPVVIAPARRNGTYRVHWRFNLGGLTIPVRVRVPEEAGWPLMPTTSRVVPITVRG